MNRLFFEIDPDHFARQICLEADHSALASLAGRCRDYLRRATGKWVSSTAAPAVLRQMLIPSRVPFERSFVLGIHRRFGPSSSAPEPLVGVLYFLHPPARFAPWYVTLLLLEPAARGQGLGTVVHGAFARWAAVRGGRHLVVSVARNNPHALRFWRDRLGYADAPGLASYCFAKPNNRSLERHLDPAFASAW